MSQPSVIKGKLEVLHNKVKELSTSSIQFKDRITLKLTNLKPKIAAIAHKAKACSMGDEEARKKREELARLLREKDTLLKDYIKKDQLEANGYSKIAEFETKIQDTLKDLEILMTKSANSNREIETIIQDIENQLTVVEEEIGNVNTRKVDRINNKNIDISDANLAELFDEDSSKAGKNDPYYVSPEEFAKVGDILDGEDQEGDGENKQGGGKKKMRNNKTKNRTKKYKRKTLKKKVNHTRRQYKIQRRSKRSK